MSQRKLPVELVETHNLALSLGRMYEGNNAADWRRALYHAIQMSRCYDSREQLVALREALNIP